MIRETPTEMVCTTMEEFERATPKPGQKLVLDVTDWDKLPIAADDPDDFSGLMTLCDVTPMANTVPNKSAQLTYEDLVKAMDEFPTMAEESLARQERVMLNIDKWQHMIACEPRAAGKTQRLRDMFLYMNIGADFHQYSRNVGLGFFDSMIVQGPRFMNLRRRLYAAVRKYEETKRPVRNHRYSRRTLWRSNRYD